MIVVQRIHLNDVTLGVMSHGGFRCFTLELPSRDNMSNVSCIPAGTYDCEITESPSQGTCLAIKDVPNRTHVLIHAGNYTRDIRGCCLVGETISDIDNDGIPDVTNSRSTLAALMATVDRRTKIMFI